MCGTVPLPRHALVAGGRSAARSCLFLVACRERVAIERELLVAQGVDIRMVPLGMGVNRLRRTRCSLLLAGVVLALLLLPPAALRGTRWKPEDSAAAGRAGEDVEPDLSPGMTQGDVLVRVLPDMDGRSTRGFFAQHGLEVVRRIPQIDVWRVESRKADSDAVVGALAQSALVVWAEPNGQVHAAGVDPNDNFYQAQQGHLRLMGLPEAWVFTTGGTDPIAVLDTGVDLDHPDLAAKVWINSGEIQGNDLDDEGNGYVDDVYGWDFVGSGAVPQDDHSHGSHVAGIAAGHTNNWIGIAGVAWEARIMPLKVLTSSGDGTWADVAEGLVYAADNGARVVNLSLGSEEYSNTIEEAVLYARSHGCLVVAAAGNSDRQPTDILYPAALPGVLAVGATTDTDAPWSLSNCGSRLDVAAPGVEILSANRSGSYYLSSGTSMATPHVSGLAALVWSLQPELTADQVASTITGTARDVYAAGWDQRTGWGRADAQAAVLSLVRPHVQLYADRSSVLVERESAILTATVTFTQGHTVPDGLSVTFSSSLGSVTPRVAVTQGGQVTTTFSSSQPGQVTIKAEVGSGFHSLLTLFVTPYRVYLPAVWQSSEIGCYRTD